jgi:peptide-methionine (S)-S-oxide reductase
MDAGFEGVKRNSVIIGLILVLVLAIAFVGKHAFAAAGNSVLPNPASDASRTAAPGTETAVFAGGCFWGIQAVFQHVQGVKSATSGYAGGSSSTAEYEVVSTGQTGHAESVEVIFDPSQVRYGQLLKVFFSVHDPTQLNHQGADTGTQYRSAIFYTNDEQKRMAEAYVAQLSQAKAFPSRIVTQVAPLKAFYEAESYHQNYATLHPNNPYIAINDAPKVEHLRQRYPELYKK